MDLWRSCCNVSSSPRKTTESPCKLEGVLKIGRFLLQTACHRAARSKTSHVSSYIVVYRYTHIYIKIMSLK